MKRYKREYKGGFEFETIYDDNITEALFYIQDIKEGKEDMNTLARLKRHIGVNIKLGDQVVYYKDARIDLHIASKGIWKVLDFTDGWCDRVILQNISKLDHRFETDTANIVGIDYFGQDLERCVTKLAYRNCQIKHTYNNEHTEEIKPMRTNSTNMVTRTMDANVDAAKVAAQIAMGKTLNAVVAKQLSDRKVLPIMVRGYADTAFGAVVIANAADFAVKQFNIQNPKARIATEAMMQAAMVELLAQVDFEGIINDVLSNVTLGDISEATA